MIYSQQQINKAINLAPIKWQNKISLKTHRSKHQEIRTTRTLSINSSSLLPHPDPLNHSKQSQNTVIQGMFHYCSAQKHCQGIFSCGKKEQEQGEKILSKPELITPTAESLRSTSSNSINEKFLKNVQVLPGDKNLQPKNITPLNISYKQDTFTTDNNFISPEIDYMTLELSKLSRRKIHCPNKTDRYVRKQDDSFNKFSLKTMRQNFTQESLKPNHEQKNSKFTHKINEFASSQVEAGCVCLPQCLWIDKWSKLIKNQFTSHNNIKNINQKTLSQIEKDICRTQPRQQFFKETKNQNSLKEVLVNYSLLNASLGYVQGMNFIASIILFHSNSIKQCSSIFNFIMKQLQYERIYQRDLAFSLILARNIAASLKRVQPQLFNYITKSGIQMEVYLRGLYFSMFANFIPLQSMHLVIDRFIKKRFQGLNQLLLGLLVYLKTQILELSPEEVAQIFTISWLQKRCKTIEWMQLVGFSQSIPINKLSF